MSTRRVASKEDGECEAPDRGLRKVWTRGYDTKGHAHVVVDRSYHTRAGRYGRDLGTVGTAVILFTGVAWMVLVFRPVEAGALVANLARRRFE